MSTSTSKPVKVKKSKKSSKTVSVEVAPQASSSSSSVASPFTHITTTMRVSVPPYFSGSQGGGLRGGVEELLDSMVMRYIPTLSGVLLSHSNHTFPSDSANILNDCPFAITDVSFDAIIWAPRVGQTLVGTHSLSSPSHLSLLIHKTFNVSIPLPHIPTDLYYFDSALADTPPPLSPSPSPEPEAAPLSPSAPPAALTQEQVDMEVDIEEKASDDEEEEDMEVAEERRRAKEEAEKKRREEKEERRAERERNEFSSGRWRSKMSGKVLGEEGEEVEFVVVAMTISSQMLSLTGSLLPLPFSIPAFPNNPHQLNHNPLDPSPAKKSKSSKSSKSNNASNDDALPLAAADSDAEVEVDEKEMSLQRAERKKARKLEKEELKRKRGEDDGEGGEVEGEKKKKKKSKA